MRLKRRIERLQALGRGKPPTGREAMVRWTERFVAAHPRHAELAGLVRAIAARSTPALLTGGRLAHAGHWVLCLLHSGEPGSGPLLQELLGLWAEHQHRRSDPFPVGGYGVREAETCLSIRALHGRPAQQTRGAYADAPRCTHSARPLALTGSPRRTRS